MSLVIYGGILRFFDLGFQSLWIDEAYTINASNAVLKHGYPLLDSGYWYLNNFISVYLSALMMKIVPFDVFYPWAVRVPGVIFGLGSIFAVYFLSKKLFQRESLAIAAAFLMTFSYHAIAWSRQARGYAALMFFILMCVYFFWRYYKTTSRRDLVISVLCLILASLSHWVALAFLPALIYLRLYRKHGPVLFLTLITFSPLIFIAVFVSETELWVRYMTFPLLPFLTIILSCLIMRSVEKVIPSDKKILIISLQVLLLVSVTYPLLSFYPISWYKISLVSPQPDYTNVYSYIKSNLNPEDIIISANPLLHRLYLSRDGLWLPRNAEPQKPDFYTNIKPINTLEEIKEIIQSNHGFVVIHNESLYSLGRNRVHYIVDNSRIKLVFDGQGPSPIDHIQVYKF